MFALGTKTKESLTLAVDIGSGSVGIALVHHTDDNATSSVLWTHREYTGINDTVKRPTINVIKTALLNAFLEFDMSGRQSMPEHLSARDIVTTQVLINAPWVLTITKTVTYSQEHSFNVTDNLIQQIIEAAHKETAAAMKELPNADELITIQSKPMTIVANGYQITSWEKATARTLRVDLATSLTHISLLEVIKEMHEKTLPATNLQVHAHTTALYACLRTLHPEITESCLLNITTEATEIAIVRNGTIQYITSIPSGTYTLARKLADKTGSLTEEAYSYLKQPYEDLVSNVTAKNIITAYESDLTVAFKETGDTLTIPRTIYVHIDQAIHEAFLEAITRAAKDSTGLAHAAHYLTGEILGTKQHSSDTAMQVAVLFSTLEREA